MAKTPIKQTAHLHYSVNVSPEDKDLIDRAAAADDEKKPSRWLRRVGLRAAREVLGESIEKKEKKGR